MTDTDKTRTALAVLGKPDRNFAYQMGALSIPYLALSFWEMDLIEGIPSAAPDDLDDEEMTDWLREKRARESECAYHLLSRRLGTRGPKSVDEVHRTLNVDLLYPWINHLIKGDKGEPVGEAPGETAEPPPNG